MSAAEEADRTLARLLHGRGFVGEEALRSCLEEARAQRAGGDEAASLAAVLLRRGLVTEQLLARARAASERLLAASTERAPPPPPPPTSPQGARLARSSERLAGSWEQLGGSGEQGRRPGAAPGQLGPWRLVRELARGGMGAVWEVAHVETGEPQALKLILERGPLSPIDPEELARFRREAESLRRLDHPGVVRLIDAALDGHPPWFVQELLPGGSLEERLRAGPLPLGEVLDLGVDLAEALQHAHARGVLHRDLKPANVLFDGQGRSRLVDFGLARAAEDHERLTLTGALLGTPNYMAPEQAIGLKEDDPRTDVYGLCGVLYAALTGHPPFQGTGAMTVIQAVINDPPPPPRQLRPETPPELEAALLRGLAKERAQRFASAEELVQALTAARDAGRPVGGRGVVWLAGIAAVSVVALLGLLALRAGRRPPPAPQPTPAAAAEPGTAVAPIPAPETPVVSPPRRRPERVWPAPLEGAAQPRRWHFAWTDLDEGEEDPSRIELELLERAVTPAAGGLLELELEVAALKATVSISALSNLRYDSRAPDGEGYMSRALQPLLGARLRLRVDPRTGEVTDPARDDFPRLDLSSLPAGLAGQGLTRLLEHAMAASTIRRHMNGASHLLPAGSGAVDERWSLPVRLWVESDWGIACTRQGRVSEEAVELTHRGQPWRQIPAPGLSLAQGGAVSSVDTTHGEARFDERGLVRARVVIEYGWQSEAQPPTRSVCTYLLERQDP